MTANLPVSTPAGRPRNRKSSCFGPALATADAEGVELITAAHGTATASPSARTVEGIIAPFGRAGRTSAGLLTFSPGGLRWTDPKRVKLLTEHAQVDSVGYAVAIEERPEGVWAKFHVPEAPDWWSVAQHGPWPGDVVLANAANGIRDAFSVGVELDAAVEALLRRANGQPVKGTGALRETSMVSVPAFDDARVGSVAASSHQLIVSGWTDGNPTQGDPAMPPTEDTQVTAGQTEATTASTSSTTSSAPNVDAAATTPAAASASQPATAATADTATASTTATGPATVPAVAGAAVTVASEPSTYSLDGSGPSIVRDAWAARMEGDPEAGDRMRRFNAEVAGANPASVQAITTAAVETTPGDGSWTPTTQRADLMRFIDGARPIISRLTTVPISDATPFSIPDLDGDSGVGDHTEGTSHNPEGDLVLTGAPIQPKAASGAFRISRELIDSSNPVLDRLAMRKMVKDYRKFTEAKAYAAIVNGLAPTLNVGTVQDLVDQLGAFVNDDDELADFFALSPTLLTTLRGDVDGNGRPMLPAVAPSNTQGTVKAGGLGVYIDNVEGVRASAVTADQGAIVREAGVLWAESKVAQFTFSEVEGPGIVKLALWAYTAAARISDEDVAVITSAAA